MSAKTNQSLVSIPGPDPGFQNGGSGGSGDETRNAHKRKQNKCSAVAEMDDRLATIDIGRKLGVCPFEGGDLGPHVTQRGLGRGLP